MMLRHVRGRGVLSGVYAGVIYVFIFSWFCGSFHTTQSVQL